MLCQEDEGPSSMNEPSTSQFNRRTMFKRLFIISTALLVLIPLLYYVIIPISVLAIFEPKELHDIVERLDEKAALAEASANYVIRGYQEKTLNVTVGDKILLILSVSPIEGRLLIEPTDNLKEEKIKINYWGRDYLITIAGMLNQAPGYTHHEYFLFRAENPGLGKLKVKSSGRSVFDDKSQYFNFNINIGER